MRSNIKFAFLFFCLAILSSCAPYKFSTLEFLEDPPEICSEEDFLLYQNKVDALHHPLYSIIPRHRCQIKWYDVGHWCTWALFGNDDDGIFGEEPSAHYKKDFPVSGCKALVWGLRNPLHNFCFYVIGTAYTCNSCLTLVKLSPEQWSCLTYQSHADTTFASEYTSFFLALNGWKPFISLRLTYNPCYSSDFYFGWRHRGNFGIKCVLLKKNNLQDSELIQ